MLEFRVLGPVEATVDGRPIPLAAAKPRALLALLLLHRNRAVGAGALVEELWGETPPETATKALQGYVSQLRKVLGADRIETRSAGYVLRVEDGELDLDRFDRLAAEGRERLAAGDAAAAADRFGEALALWRGAPFAEFGAEPFARDARGQLEAARIAAVEDRIEAELALGRHAALVPELEALTAKEPFRERVAGLLMVALYRSGRQADALEAYRRTRTRLVDELGIEPGEELQELHRAILRHDDSLVVPTPAAPSAAVEAPAAPSRRWPLVALAAAAIAIAAVATVFAVTRDGGSGSDSTMRPFVHKLEGFLGQSALGRQQVVGAIHGATQCKLGRAAAVAEINRVERNRQSLLQAVAALNVPDENAAIRASDLLQQAIQASIATDEYYRDWLVDRGSCVPGARPGLKALLAADAEATRAKKQFVAAFNPLARDVHARVWGAGEF